MNDQLDGRRRLLMKSSLALCGAGALPGAFAATDAWRPSAPIRVIVPFPAGGIADQLIRQVSDHVAATLGKPVVVENKGGANGSIGSQAVSRSAPDGSTFVVATTDSHSIYPHVFPKPIFNPKEQVPVAPLAIIPFALMVRSDLPVSNLKQFAELANRTQLSYASWGNASAAHTATIMLNRATGISKMLHVPYQGTAPALMALLSGQVDAVMGPVLMANPNKGKLKIIAMMTPERVPSAPDIPTFAEQGVPLRRDGEFWIGIFAPPGTPPNIVNAVADAFHRATAAQDYRDRLNTLGLLPQSASVSEYAAFYEQDYVRWGRLVKEADIRLE